MAHPNHIFIWVFSNFTTVTNHYVIWVLRYTHHKALRHIVAWEKEYQNVMYIRWIGFVTSHLGRKHNQVDSLCPPPLSPPGSPIDLWGRQGIFVVSYHRAPPIAIATFIWHLVKIRTLKL